MLCLVLGGWYFFKGGDGIPREPAYWLWGISLAGLILGAWTYRFWPYADEQRFRYFCAHLGPNADELLAGEEPAPGAPRQPADISFGETLATATAQQANELPVAQVTPGGEQTLEPAGRSNPYAQH